LDHKAEFEHLVRKLISDTAAESVEWSSPRVMCIASNFTRYDEHAVQQISRNIELIRYKKFGSEFLLLELVNSGAAKPVVTTRAARTTATTESAYGVAVLATANQEVRDLFSSLEAHVLALGDDVQRKDLKLYTAFKRIRNFTTVEFYKDKLLLHLSLNPDNVDLVEGFTRDVRTIGHWGTGDLEVWVRNTFDLERAKPLIKEAFEGGPARAQSEWTEEAVIEMIKEKRSYDEATVAGHLIDWSKKNAPRINWGKGSNDGSFCPVFDLGSGYPFIPFRLYTYGSIEILFNRMAVRQNAPFDQLETRLELLRLLNEIPGVALPVDGINRRPSIPLSALVNSDSLSKFVSAIEWALQEVKAGI
jgi:predicted transport protein